MKVRDFIKVFDGDIDVYDNYTEELGIAYCGKIQLTPEGKKKFQKALNLPVESLNTERMIVDVSGKDLSDEECNARLQIAKELFEGMAGYCADKDYNKWFIEP